MGSRLKRGLNQLESNTVRAAHDTFSNSPGDHADWSPTSNARLGFDNQDEARSTITILDEEQGDVDDRRLLPAESEGTEEGGVRDVRPDARDDSVLEGEWPFKKKSATAGRRNNRWTEGDVILVLPPLSPEDVGAYGARFYSYEFQKHSGIETCLCIFEEPEWGRRYGSIKRMDLYVTTMAIRTDSGPVAIALWNLLDSGDSLCHYEHYLDPLSERTLQSLHKMEKQSRLKLVMRDNQSGETTGFWEFDNNFQMGDFASSLADAFDRRAVGSFDDRVAEVKHNYTTEQLIAMIQQ